MWTPEEMGNTNIPISSLDKEIGSTASVARSSMVKVKMKITRKISSTCVFFFCLKVMVFLGFT